MNAERGPRWDPVPRSLHFLTRKQKGPQPKLEAFVVEF